MRTLKAIGLIVLLILWVVSGLNIIDVISGGGRVAKGIIRELIDS